ncbi:MAG TPA: hypothetical protein VMU99_09240 [Acidimicrobiales bacterium]|nr:hypothetical protein [Acidimicrobiales bacterium]
MLGPVSGVASAARRRARRRRRLIVVGALLVVFVVAELIHQIVNASTPAQRRTAGSWVATVAPTITDANLLSSTLSYVEIQGSKMSRPKLILILRSLAVASNAEVASLITNTLGAPSRHAKELLVLALELRARSFAGFDEAVTSVISGGSVATASQRLTLSSTIMASAQSHYRNFVRALPKGSAPSQLPGVDWYPSGGAFAPATLNHLASSLAKASQLRIHRALEITAISLNPLPEVIPTTTTTTTTTTIPKKSRTSSSRKTPNVNTRKPSPTTTTTLPKISQIPAGNSPSVFAPTSSVRPIVVLKNQGNVTETNVSVEVVMDRETVNSAVLGSLAPGDSRYLELSSLPVVPSRMSKCSSISLHHDRCTSMEVLIKSSVRVRAHRSVFLAFFVG